MTLKGTVRLGDRVMVTALDERRGPNPSAQRFLGKVGEVIPWFHPAPIYVRFPPDLDTLYPFAPGELTLIASASNSPDSE